MNKRRLLALATLLEKLPRKRFNYASWVGGTWDGKSDLTACGTTACALGWATTMPCLRREGVILRQNAWGYACVTTRNRPSISRPCEESLRTASKVFAITLDEAEHMFLPGASGLPSTATAKRVARHIREFVKRGGMP